MRFSWNTPGTNQCRSEILLVITRSCCGPRKPGEFGQTVFSLPFPPFACACVFTKYSLVHETTVGRSNKHSQDTCNSQYVAYIVWRWASPLSSSGVETSVLERSANIGRNSAENVHVLCLQPSQKAAQTYLVSLFILYSPTPAVDPNFPTSVLEQ